MLDTALRTIMLGRPMKLIPALLISLLIAAAGFLGGCTTAGPFVTNISSDGQGNLVVEKNTVHFNAFTGAVSSGEAPTVQTIRIHQSK
ncbi:hypothetical protein OpiT1DRAFT_01257 [Opitutaceae bacterium TAV1]|nr:hypothetical protein OpiT1DRAFT_01257 [Opitutaceae bacterium TAV1]